MPTITIGIPTYNRGGHLRSAIENILGQTYQDFELIVSDDASIDDTEEVVKEFTDCRIRYHRNPVNIGIPGNLNSILILAKGDYIIFLHDHDVFKNNLLEKLINLYKKDTDLGFVHPGVAWIDPDGGNYTELLLDDDEIIDGNKLVREILMGSGFSCPVTACSLVSKKAFSIVGLYYDQRFGFVSDTDLWLRLATRFRVGYVREPLILCRRREKNHAFGGINWNLLEWSTHIHKENIDRVYSGNITEHRKALKILDRKKEKAIYHTILATVAHGDLDAFRVGVQKIITESYGFSRLLGIVLGKLSFFHPVFVRFTSVVWRVTKRGREHS